MTRKIYLGGVSRASALSVGGNGGTVFVPPGSELSSFMAAYAGTGTVLLLKGNTFTNPYTLNLALVKAGTYMGGVTIQGPIAPSRKTFSGPIGGGVQLTASALAGSAAVINFIDGDHVDYVAGSAGHGMDGLSLVNVVIYGPAALHVNNYGFVFDSSAAVNLQDVKVVDMLERMCMACYSWTAVRSTTCESSTNATAAVNAAASTLTYAVPTHGSYTVDPNGATMTAISINGGASVGTQYSGTNSAGDTIAVTYSAGQPLIRASLHSGSIHDPWLLDLTDDLFDAFSTDHMSYGTDGTNNNANATSYGFPRWAFHGTCQYGPSGLYSTDAYIDSEFGAAAQLAELRGEIVQTWNAKVDYMNYVGKVTWDTISVRFTKTYSQPNVGCAYQPGAPPAIFAGPPSVLNGPSTCHVKFAEIIYETGCPGATASNGTTTTGQFPGIISWKNYAYIGTIVIDHLRCIVDGVALNQSSAFSVPALFEIQDPSITGTNHNFDLIWLKHVELGVTLSYGGTATRNVKAGQTVYFFSCTSPNGATTTWGQFRLDEIVYLGSNGMTPGTWPGGTPTTTVAFPITQEGTYQVLGATGLSATITTVAGVTMTNGAKQGSTTSCAYHLRQGESITLTFTGSPTFNYYAGQEPATTRGDATNALWLGTYDLGYSSGTTTLSEEAIGTIDYSQLAANAMTNAPRTLGSGHTSTLFLVSQTNPRTDTHTTITVGASPMTYTHGTTALVSSVVPQGASLISFSGGGNVGTTGGITYNGATIKVSANAAFNLSLIMEIGDTVIYTYSGTGAAAGVMTATPISRFK